MSPTFATLMAINNFMHDLVSGIPLASGIAMWAIISQCEKNRDEETEALMFRLYRWISRIFIVSLIWITVGAIPRILTFTRFESAHAVRDNNMSGLIALHVTIFAAVMSGMFLWIALTRRVRRSRAAR